MRKKILCISIISIILIMFFIHSNSNKQYTIKQLDNTAKIKQIDSDVGIDLGEEINDLLYRKYSKGVKLSANETMKIILPKDKVSDVEFIIINNSMNRVESILKYKYTEDKSVSYTVKQVGVYTVYGITIDKNSKKELIDLTDRISYEKNYDISGSNYVY